MPWRPIGRAEVDTDSPRAFAVCDRCGFLHNHYQLQFQYQWAGAKKINKRILVCPTCLDTASEFLKTLILPADPPPIINPRPENYTIDEA